MKNRLINYAKKSLIMSCCLLLMVLNFSCRTIKISTESKQTTEKQQTDSVSLLIEREIKPVTVPQSTAAFTISFDQLDSLPAGAAYQQRSGNATGTVIKNNDNTLTFTANCDSLTLLVETLKKEVYHFQRENTTLKSELNEHKTEVIKEPSGWQWFQIKGFWILLAAIFLYVVFRILKCRFDKWINVPYKSI